MHIPFSYPSFFIEKEFRKFFLESISSSPFLPFITNENEFSITRHKLLNIQTVEQPSIITINATRTNFENNQIHEKNLQEIQSITKTKQNKTSQIIPIY